MAARRYAEAASSVLDVSPRVRGVLLASEKYRTLGGLLQAGPEIASLKGLGVRSLAEIHDALAPLLVEEDGRPAGEPPVGGHPGPAEREVGLAADVEAHLLERVRSSRDDRTAQVIAGRYGLAGRQAVTLAELGRRMGLSRERVRQIEVRGLRLAVLLAAEAAAAPPTGTTEVAAAIARLHAVLLAVRAAAVLEEDLVRSTNGALGRQGSRLAPVARVMAASLGLRRLPPPSPGVPAVWAAEHDLGARARTRRAGWVDVELTRYCEDALTAAELAAAVSARHRTAVSAAEVEDALGLCPHIESLPGGRYRARLDAVTSDIRKIVRLLREAGHPLHVNELSQVIGGPSQTGERRAVPIWGISRLIPPHSGVRPVGRTGYWSLSDDSYDDGAGLLALILRCMILARRPLTTDEIFQRVSELRPVRRDLVELYLSTHERFRRRNHGTWSVRRPVERQAVGMRGLRVVEFVRASLEVDGSDSLPLDDLAADLAARLYVRPATVVALLRSLPAVRVADDASGRELVMLRDRRPEPDVPHAREVLNRRMVEIVRSRPDHRMPLWELRGLLQAEFGLSDASVYLAVRMNAWLETSRIRGRSAGKMVSLRAIAPAS